MAGRKLPPFEKVGSEQRNGQTWVHVRLKVPEKNINPKELPQYWLVLDAQGQPQYIVHTEMPMFSQVRKEVMYCSFDYALAKETSRRRHSGRPSMTRLMALTTSSNTSSIGRARLFASR
jgi:hypothetical protein